MECFYFVILQEHLPIKYSPPIVPRQSEEFLHLPNMTENGPPQMTRPVIPSENKTRIPRPMLCRVTLLNGEEFEVSIDVSSMDNHFYLKTLCLTISLLSCNMGKYSTLLMSTVNPRGGRGTPKVRHQLWYLLAYFLFLNDYY